MKDIMKWIMLFAPVVAYIGIFQILFPPQYSTFKAYYVADILTIEQVESDGNMEIVSEYQDKDGFYVVEVISSSDVIIKLKGQATVNGQDMFIDSGNVEVFVKGNNFILVSRQYSIMEHFGGNFTIHQVNEEQVTSGVTISVGTIIGIVFVLLIFRSKLPVDMKITVSLSVLTGVLFMMLGIIQDMFNVVVAIDIGWLSYLGINALPSKQQRLDKKIKKAEAKYFGVNV